MYRTNMEKINFEMWTIFFIYTVKSFNVVSTQHGALLEEAEAWIVESSRT